MRVLMVSDVYFPRINGVSTSIETFRHTLAGQGVEVRVVAPRYGDEPEQPGVARVPGRPVPRDPEDRIVAWRAMWQTVRAHAADSDLIHIQTPFAAHYTGLRAARREGVPVLATYHTLFEEYLQHYAPFLPARGLRALARLFSRRQCNALDGIVVPSQAMHERLSDYGVKRPIHVLPTGIPLGRFAGGSRARFRAAHGIGAVRPVALFVGRVAHEKNIGFLLEMMVAALRRRPDLLLLIAGPARAGGAAWPGRLGAFYRLPRPPPRAARLLRRRRCLRLRLAHGNTGPGAARGDGDESAGGGARPHGYGGHPGAAPRLPRAVRESPGLCRRGHQGRFR